MGERRMEKRQARRLFALLLTLIVVGSLIPEDPENSNVILSLNWNGAHLPAYFLLTLSAMLAGIGSRGVRLLYASALLTSVIGALIEIIQPHFGRTMSLEDALHNEIGVALALAVAVWRGWYLRVPSR